MYFIDKSALFMELKRYFYLSLFRKFKRLHGKLYHHSRFIPWSDAIY